jgi:hypothetical protein
MRGSVAPIDDAVLRTLRERARTHSLVSTVTTERTGDTISVVRLECDPDRYPERVKGTRLEIRWYTNGDYNFHYLETHADDIWQCRWDRHPNPHTRRTHFHPPPGARSTAATPDHPSDRHPTAMFSRTLANLRQRIDDLWDDVES